MGTESFAENVFEKVFNRDIARLADMKDMWKTRKAPEPLSFHDLAKETGIEAVDLAGKDQSLLSIAENFAMFCKSLDRLSERTTELKKNGENVLLSFDKDDEDTLEFVAASANLRSVIFGIESRTKFDIKRELYQLMTL